MSAGSVRVSRDFFDDDAFKNEALSEREAFLWMIMEASFRERTRRIGRSSVALRRGEFAASIRFLQKAWKWASTRRVHAFLCALQNRNMIETQAGTDCTVVRLCNYDKYQSNGTPSETLAERETERSRNAGGTNENKDEIRVEEREGKPSLVRSAGFSDFWDAYPHRGGAKRNRKGAEAKYAAAVRRGISEQDIIEGARRAHGDRRVIDGYARDPTTWLTQEGWRDEIEQNITPFPSNRPKTHGERYSELSAALDARLAERPF